MSIKKRPDIKAVDADSFIRGAEATPEPEKPTAPTEARPWDSMNPRIVKGINLRLPEPVWGKLDFLRERTNKSIQRIIMEALLPEIDKQIQEVTGKK